MNKETTWDVLVAGHICLDLLPSFSQAGGKSFEQSFLPGRLVNAGDIKFATGGPVSNTGLALNRLGVSTRLVGKVGQDNFGDEIMKIIHREGESLAEGMLVSPTDHTSYSIVISFPGSDRLFIHYTGANDTFNSQDIPYPLLEKSRLFHFGYPPVMRRMFENDGQELTSLLQRAKQTGVTTSMDMVFPDPSSSASKADWSEILKRTLPYVDLFLPSVEEILFLLRRDQYNELLQQADSSNILELVTPELLSQLSNDLIGMGAKIVGLKVGYRGFYLRTGEINELVKFGRAMPTHFQYWNQRELWAPCFKVKVAGTTGSGDATIAGFLSSLLRDLSPEQSITAAVGVGACNVEAEDALSGIRSWDETIARIAAGWEQNALQLNSPGWVYSDTHRLWIGPGH